MLVSVCELMESVDSWGEKYDISMQLWGKDNRNFYICGKDIHQTDLHSGGGYDSVRELSTNTLDWIEGVNRVKDSKSGVIARFELSQDVGNALVGAFYDLDGNLKIPTETHIGMFMYHCIETSQKEIFKESFDLHKSVNTRVKPHIEFICSIFKTPLKIELKSYHFEESSPVHTDIVFDEYEFITKRVQTSRKPNGLIQYKF